MPFYQNANRVLVKAIIMCLLSVIRGKNVGFLDFCLLETFALNIAYRTWVSVLVSVFLKHISPATVVPTKSDSDIIFCLQLLRKTLHSTLHLS